MPSLIEKIRSAEDRRQVNGPNGALARLVKRRLNSTSFKKEAGRRYAELRSFAAESEKSKVASRNPYPLGSLPGDEALAKRFADARAKRLAAIAAEQAKKKPLNRLKALFRR